MTDSLIKVRRIKVDIESYLDQLGEVFRAFRDQDSGCISYGVLAGGTRWFVKHSDEPRGFASLRRAQHLHSTVRHEALPGLHNAFETPGGLALVFDWVPGEPLYDYTRFRGEAGRRDPASPHTRFRALPLAQILKALDTIYDVHLLLAGQGFVAVDFYDGCLLYDFHRGRTYLCDLDEYRPGPFVLEADRLPGSRRFMAPEEWKRGATIDQVTNVFTLGRTAVELLGDGTTSLDTFRGNEAMKRVVVRATSVEREERQQSVREFVQDWRSAAGALLLGDRFKAQAAREGEQCE
jgi:serine/threonine-protein kinase